MTNHIREYRHPHLFAPPSLMYVHLIQRDLALLQRQHFTQEAHELCVGLAVCRRCSNSDPHCLRAHIYTQNNTAVTAPRQARCASNSYCKPQPVTAFCFAPGLACTAIAIPPSLRVETGLLGVSDCFFV